MASSYTQFLSLQIMRQMEYLNLCLQEVAKFSNNNVVTEEQSVQSQDEEQEEEVAGHFFLLPSGLAYYLFSFLQPADLSRACQVFIFAFWFEWSALVFNPLPSGVSHLEDVCRESSAVGPVRCHAIV